MQPGPLDILFERHFVDPTYSLARFRWHLSTAKLDFVEPNLRVEEVPYQPSCPVIPSVISYFIPGTGYGSIKKIQPSATSSLHLKSSDGFGLNMGCPVRLARALHILFSLGQESMIEPLQKLKSSQNHLACIEELLWLTLWKKQLQISRGGELVPRLDGTKGKDVDWFFWSDGTPVYLEAKFRQSDWMRFADAQQGQIRPNFFSDIGSKFPQEKPTFQKCIAAITGFAQPDGSFLAFCEDKLLKTPGLSAILYRAMLGPVTVCGLDLKTVNQIAQRLKIPGPNEYPHFYGIGFNRLLQHERLQEQRSAFPKTKGRMFYTFVPRAVQDFRPEYPHRSKQPTWSSKGCPKLEYVPPFLPKAA